MSPPLVPLLHPGPAGHRGGCQGCQSSGLAGGWAELRRGVADHTHFWVPGCSGPVPDIFGGLGSRVCRMGKAREGD